MKECKCGKIPPCYGSLEFAIYEEAKKVNDEWKKSRARHYKIIDKMRAKLMEGEFLNDTHDKVYGVNKQMCDLDIPLRNPIKPLSEEAAQELIGKWDKIGREWDSKKWKIVDSIFNKIDMEKKTKQITKAEAFEYFKGKRVACDCYNKEAVQRKFFKVGIRWRGGSTEVTDCALFLFVDANGCITHCNSRVWFDLHEYEEISADDILSIEIMEEKKDDERKGEILDEIAKLGEKISDLIEEYGGDVMIEINEFEVILRDCGDILYRR